MTGWPTLDRFIAYVRDHELWFFAVCFFFLLSVTLLGF